MRAIWIPHSDIPGDQQVSHEATPGRRARALPISRTSCSGWSRPVELGRTVSRSLPSSAPSSWQGCSPAGWTPSSGEGGLIQLPALLLGLPDASPAAILATNKVSAVVGTTMARRHLRPPGCPSRSGRSLPTALVAAAGSVLGALWAHICPGRRDSDRRGLIAVPAPSSCCGPTSARSTGHAMPCRGGPWSPLGSAFSSGGYDGALGPGTGSFLVFGLVALVGYGFLQASATAKVVNVATNLGALVVFLHAVVVWPAAAALASGNLVGGYVGARTAVARGTASSGPSSSSWSPCSSYGSVAPSWDCGDRSHVRGTA